MISRIGVLGGMFDPVHNGHIEAAHYARRRLRLDLVKLVPCARPNHRRPSLAAAHQRLAMLELATAQHEGLAADPVEIERQGTSYTVDTLAGLAEQYPGATIIFILGLDSFNTLPEWHEWTRLPGLCGFLVLARAGTGLGAGVAEALNLRDRQVDSPETLLQAGPGAVFMAEDFNCDLSSTRVRAALAGGGGPGPAGLDENVLDYIKRHKLYH